MAQLSFDFVRIIDGLGDLRFDGIAEAFAEAVDGHLERSRRKAEYGSGVGL